MTNQAGMTNRRSRASLHHAALGLTLVELLVLICCAFLGALYARRAMGGWWWLLGGLVGYLLPLIGLIVFAFLSDLATGGMPRLPKCREGTCRGPYAYKYSKLGGEYYWVCGHGGRYRRRGRKFVIVDDDGRETPYLVWRPFRGWFPDG
ncbi:MAG: hypothetical protein ABSC42_08040 [Tepidisphaeraceae bacterium]|jgi:hypothetical protein